MKEQRLNHLFDLYLNQAANPAEEAELMQLLADPTLTEERQKLVENAYDKLPAEYTLPDIQANTIYNKITEDAQQLRINVWRRISVAASIIFAVAFGSYFLFLKKDHLQNTATQRVALKDVTAPKGSKAMIQLANGNTVLLNSINSGTLASQGNIKVLKEANGEIVYSGEETEVSYNTLVNPRGSNVVNITLQDGSKVWLNSESSIKYPTAFSGKERKVELAGEAYFEVAHNAAMPFKVNVAGKEEVEVLGTHFNINSYSDEPAVKTTLLEGSVKVSKGLSSILIKPGEQAAVSDKDNNIAVKKDVDIDEVIAWKNEKFIFQDLDLKSIMRQVEKWYDVDITYTGHIPDKQYVGVISRNVNITQILKMLETASSIKFDIEGRKVIVK